jgi:aminoglycoside 6'-N-acetyltransferase
VGGGSQGRPLGGLAPTVSDYVFRALVPDDLPLLLRRWLALPHVTEWWGDPDEQVELIGGDLDHPDMDQFIVAAHDRPFAYLRCYALGSWNEGFGPQPPGTRGSDQFIGEPGMIGRAHGSGFIRQFAGKLLASGLPRLVTDPDPDNGRAIRAYTKAGFHGDRLVDTPDGHALLMVRDR